MTPSQAEQEENASTLRKIYKEKYKKASSETKGKKPKFKIGEVKITQKRKVNTIESERSEKLIQETKK